MTVTMLTDRPALVARALEALAAREAEQTAELARLEAERAERLERYAIDALSTVTGGGGCVTFRTPARRPAGWELTLEVGEIDFVLVDPDDGLPHLRVIQTCPECGEVRESEPVRDLADLGAAIRDGDDLCLTCLGPEWTAERVERCAYGCELTAIPEVLYTHYQISHAETDGDRW